LAVSTLLGCEGAAARPHPVSPRERTAAHAETPGAPDHRAQSVSPGPLVLADLDVLQARADRLVAGRLLALDAAAAAPDACVVGVAAVTFRRDEVTARCRARPVVAVAALAPRGATP
jgi:hypothetical protein